MNLIKPKKLKVGDTIAIIAPSGCCDIDKINKAKKYFEKKGYKIKLSSNITKSKNSLAGSDNERAESINNAFADNEVDAIICARGGYGAIRLLEDIDYNLIKSNPKIFCGYSDITILNILFLKKCNLITFSAPMAQSDFAKEKLNSFTEESFYNALTGFQPEIIAHTPKFYSKKNEANGVIFGGNLSSVASLCGTDFIPDNKFIFIAEDLNEPVYKIDRYFSQLFNIKQFKDNIQAIALGKFLDIDDEKYFDDFFYELADKYNIPVISGFPISHEDYKATIPHGTIAKLRNNRLIVNDYLCE